MQPRALLWSATYCWSSCRSSNYMLGEAEQSPHSHPVFVLIAFFGVQDRSNWNGGISESLWLQTNYPETINLVRTNNGVIGNHLAPSLLGLLGDKGTKAKLHRVYSEQPLWERYCCQPSWVSWRTTEFAHYFETVFVCMSPAGDILCTNRKHNMQLRITKMLLSEKGQVLRLKCAPVWERDPGKLIFSRICFHYMV